MANDPLAASGLDRQLGFALRHASVAVWNDLRRTLEPFGLRPQTYAVLLLIANSPGCKQQEVADALGIQRPNLVSLIDRLCEQGLLERRVNAGDRRSYTLSLTTSGRALLARSQVAHDVHQARVEATLDGYNAAGALRLLSGLSKI